MRALALEGIESVAGQALVPWRLVVVQEWARPAVAQWQVLQAGSSRSAAAF